MISLKILGATEVMSLLATSVSFVYLMAWVVLHEEFVGTRVRGTDTRFTTSLPKWKRRLMLGTPQLFGIILFILALSTVKRAKSAYWSPLVHLLNGLHPDTNGAPPILYIV